MGRPVPGTKQETLDPSHMAKVLDAVAKSHFGEASTVREVKVEPCGRRLVRYEVLVVDGQQSHHFHWRVLGKVFETSEEGLLSFNAIRQVWNNGFSDQPPVFVRIPEGYMYIPDLCLLLMEEIPGQPLKKLVKKQIATPVHMRLFGAAMAKVHRCPLVVGEPFTVEDHLARRCGGLHEKLAEAFPDLNPSVRWITQTAKDFQQRDGQGIFTLAHGDFHFGQVHIEDENLWILDLDPLHYGDPAYDVAMVFFAIKQIAKKMGQKAYVFSLRDAFLSSYFSQMGWDVARRVPLHEAMIHLKRACKRLRWQDEEGWERLIPVQIRQAEMCLKYMEQAKEPRSLADMVAAYDGCPGDV